MPTNPIGKGTKNLVVNVPDSLYDALQELAAKNNMKLGPYVRLVLADAQKRGVQFTVAITPSDTVRLMGRPQHPADLHPNFLNDQAANSASSPAVEAIGSALAHAAVDAATSPKPPPSPVASVGYRVRRRSKSPKPA